MDRIIFSELLILAFRFKLALTMPPKEMTSHKMIRLRNKTFINKILIKQISYHNKFWYCAILSLFGQKK